MRPAVDDVQLPRGGCGEPLAPPQGGEGLGRAVETDEDVIDASTLPAPSGSIPTPGRSATVLSHSRIGRNVSRGAGGDTVHRPGHWLFEGTGLGWGDLLGVGSTVVGDECDGCELTMVDGRSSASPATCSTA